MVFQPAGFLKQSQIIIKIIILVSPELLLDYVKDSFCIMSICHYYCVHNEFQKLSQNPQINIPLKLAEILCLIYKNIYSHGTTNNSINISNKFVY